VAQQDKLTKLAVGAGHHPQELGRAAATPLMQEPGRLTCREQQVDSLIIVTYQRCAFAA